MIGAGRETASGGQPDGPPTSSPYATVLVPTYRRADRLRLALAALANQTCIGGWELLVVDNDPGGSALTTVEAAATDFPVPVRYLIEPENGAAHARNHGIAEAHGEVVVMCDDDVIPQPGWLAHLVEPLRDGRYDGVGGPVELDPSAWRPAWLTVDDIRGYLAAFSLGELAREVAPEEFVYTANAAFRLDVLRTCGGFDPAFGPRAGRQLVNDDKQLCRAFRGVGGRLGYVPQAAVTHDLPYARVRLAWICQRAYWQGRSDFRLDRQHLQSRRLRGLRMAVEELGWETRGMFQRSSRRRDSWLHLLLPAISFVGKVREAATWSVTAPPGERGVPR